MSGELLAIEGQWLRRSFDVARAAEQAGNAPFGAVLVSAEGIILGEAGNTAATSGDVTAHAETNLARFAAMTVDGPARTASTLYSSCEPCPMCCGALFWAGIGRLVYGLSDAKMRGLLPDGASVIAGDARAVLAGARPVIRVAGPALEDEALAVHGTYWR